jgi:Ca-activated chloride channel family protein
MKAAQIASIFYAAQWIRAALVLLLAAPMGADVLPQQQTAPPAPQSAPIVRQAPSSPGPAVIHVDTRLVSVALNVVDEHGAPVGGLTVDDFELAEDGKPQKISFFDRESSTPLEIVLAIDGSGSVMPDEHLEKEAAKSFVRSLLRQQDRIDLMAFSDDVVELVSFTNDAKRVESGIGRIQRGDATALYDAIYLASQRLAEEPNANSARRVIVLITDGEDTTRHGSYDSALEQAERAGAMIYSLIIVPIDADAGRNTGGEHALIQMSNDTGGKYYYVEDKHDLGPAFQHVSDDLRTQYTVGYYAPRKTVDAADLRHIQIQMKDPALRAKYSLRYRTAYYPRR